MGSAEPHSRAENREKSHFFRVFGTFEAEVEAFLSRTVIVNENWLHHFEKDSKLNPWKGTILNLPEDTIEELFVRGQGQDHRFMGLSGSDYCGHDAATEDSQLRRLHQDADRTHEAFQTSPVSQEPNRNLASE